MGNYPKLLRPRDTSGSLAIFGLAGIVGFALVFAITWYFPSAGMIWLAVAAAQLVFGLVFSRNAIWRSFFVLILTGAAVFAAAALR